MKRVLFLLLIVSTVVMMSSCINDDDEVILLEGSSWKVVETSDSELSDVIMAFRANGELTLSKEVEGWNNAKWSLTQGMDQDGKTRYLLTIAAGDGTSYAAGYFVITGTDRASYTYSWYDNGQDESSLTTVHWLTLDKL